MRILIAGGTGFIGQHLTNKLLEQGHEVMILSRNPRKAKQKFGTLQQSIGFVSWQQPELNLAISQTDAVINLSGKSIFTLWTKQAKQKILNSRVETTRTLVESLNQNEESKILINISAVGYYGTSQTKTFVEDSSAGTDFLAQVCKEWEKTANNLQTHHRLVIIRSGLVLSLDGGFLKILISLFRIFGGSVPDGKQWLSWIALKDLVNIITYSVENKRLIGPINAVAPIPITMTRFCKLLTKSLNRPYWPNLPAWLIKPFLGDMSSIILEGQKVIPKKLEESRFLFEYPNLEDYFRATFQKPQR